MMSIEENVLDELYSFFQTHKYKRKKYGRKIKKLIKFKNQSLDYSEENNNSIVVFGSIIKAIIENNIDFSDRDTRSAIYRDLDPLTLTLLEEFNKFLES